MSVTLILGGARSGKSRRAEALAKQLAAEDRQLIYIATAPLIRDDHEWMQRIALHRQQRGDCWQLVEEALDLIAALGNHARCDAVLLVDCLTLWLSNLIYADKPVDDAVAALCTLLPTLDGDVILVANEVGMGLVPEHPEGRAFRDAQGRLNQAVAVVADRVEFIAAGLPMRLK